MKPASGIRAFSRIFASVLALVAAIGYYSHVRAQSGGLPEQGMVIPLRPLAPLSTVPVPPVFGMEGILADKTAAIQLGKALFWDMQAGSDDIQACASCHFNAGADSRAINEINPGQAGGDNNFEMGAGPNYHLSAGSSTSGFGGYHDGDRKYPEERCELEVAPPDRIALAIERDDGRQLSRIPPKLGDSVGRQPRTIHFFDHRLTHQSRGDADDGANHWEL